MADQPITGLPTKTASGVASTDKMLGIDSAEGYQILVRDVAKYIIENCNVSTLAGAVQTPKQAIDGLNSKLPSNQNNETQMKLIALGTRDVTFSNGVCVLDLTTILNANFRSNKTLSQCMMVQALSTSSSFVVSSHKTGDWEMTIRAARLNQQDFSENIAVNIIIFVY